MSQKRKRCACAPEASSPSPAGAITASPGNALPSFETLQKTTIASWLALDTAYGAVIGLVWKERHSFKFEHLSSLRVAATCVLLLMLISIAYYCLVAVAASRLLENGNSKTWHGPARWAFWLAPGVFALFAVIWIAECYAINEAITPSPALPAAK